MNKRLLALLLMCFCIVSSFSSCKGNKSEIASSEASSSSKPEKPVSSIVVSSGSYEENNNEELYRPTFMTQDEQGNIYYCSSNGSIFKKIVNTNKLSKIFSNSDFNFFSVQYIGDNKLSAGYKSKLQNYGYITLDLKDKKISTAVKTDKLKDDCIYSLIYHKNIPYFLCDADRYHRYSLCKEENGEQIIIDKGVNEFFIVGDTLIYNIGSSIYSYSINTKEKIILQEIPSNDLTGFTVFSDNIFFMTSSGSYYSKLFSQKTSHFPSPLNVYTGIKYDKYIIFCGEEGGIYAFSLDGYDTIKLTDYTARRIAIVDDFLYLEPTKKEYYPNLNDEQVITDGIYRISISKLFEYYNILKDGVVSSSPSTSNSISESSLSSSDSNLSEVSSQYEIAPPSLEKFGR